MHPLYRLSLPRFLPAHLPHLQGAGIKSALALLLAADCSPLPYPTRTAYTIGGMLRLANSLQDVSRQLCPRGRAYAPLAPVCCCCHRCCAPAAPCITSPRELDRRPPLLCCLPLLQYGAAVAVLRYAQQRGVPLERSLWQR